MLKPKRKTTKEEIKKDSFVETVFNFRVLLKENSQILIRSVSVVGALIVIIILFSRINENNKNEAELLLTKSSLYRDNGDSQNAKIYLQELVDEYGSTESGRIGGYNLAQIYIAEQRFDDALPLLEKYSSKGNNLFLIASSNQSLSSIYSKKGELEKAIKFQEKAVKTAHSNNSRAENMVKLAYLHLKNGNIDQTNNIINDLKKDFSENIRISQKIDELFGQIMSQ